MVLDGHMSDWLPVVSGVPQGSDLSPILFILTILMSILIVVLRFVEDANVFSEVSPLHIVANLQSDLDKLHEYPEDWQMMFNAQNCKCLHICYKKIMQITL